MAVGVNISPGWGDTVDGRNIPRMKQLILGLRPHTLRMPWMQPGSDGGRTADTLRFASENNIETIVIDNATWPVEEVVKGVAATVANGAPITAIEGVNEPDVPASGYTTTAQPITEAKLAEVAARQKRLYELVAGRWIVLSPSAVYELNEPKLHALPHDVRSIHRYHPSDGTAPEPDCPHLRVPAGDSPVWVTECGISSWKKRYMLVMTKWVVTLDQQAAFLVQSNAKLRANGAERVIIYTLQNTGQTNAAHHNFGLHTWDGVAKPAAVALRG